MTERKHNLYTLLIFFGIFMLEVGLLGIRQFYFVDKGVSKNDILVDIVFPLAIFIIMFVSPFLAAKLSPVLAGFDQTWLLRPRTKIRWYVLLIVLSLFAFMIMGTISKYTGLPIVDTFIYKDISKLTAGFFICRAILTMFLGPVSEEVFFRGYAQDQFCKCFGKRTALFLQAFLFALLHMRPLLGFTGAFIPGLIWGFWRQKRRSLIPIIIAHILLNGIYVLGHYPDLYEMSRKKISKNYMDELNRIGNTHPAEENAEFYYAKAWKLFVDPPQEIFGYIKKDVGLKDLPTEQQKIMSLWIAENTDAIAMLKQGTQKPFYWPNYVGTMQDFALNENYRKMINIAFALCWDAKQLAQDGEAEKAIDELLDCYRFGCHLMEGPKPMTSQLTGMGIKQKVCKTGFLLMDSTKMSSEQIRCFRTQFELLLRVKKQTPDLTCEKLFQYDIIQGIFTDDGNSNGHIPQLELKAMKEDPCQLYQTFVPYWTKDRMKEWGRADRKQTVALTEEVFEFLKNAYTKTPMQLKKENLDISNTIDEKAGNSIIYMYIPALAKIHHIFYENKAFGSAFVTTLAIFSYKNTCHAFPENLEILVPEGYLESLPTDPYSDKPLIYKKAGDSFILYSVGGDFKDDGGKHSDTWSSPGRDYVFWPPDKQDTPE